MKVKDIPMMRRKMMSFIAGSMILASIFSYSLECDQLSILGCGDPLTVTIVYEIAGIPLALAIIFVAKKVHIASWKKWAILLPASGMWGVATGLVLYT